MEGLVRRWHRVWRGFVLILGANRSLCLPSPFLQRQWSTTLDPRPGAVRGYWWSACVGSGGVVAVVLFCGTSTRQNRPKQNPPARRGRGNGDEDWKAADDCGGSDVFGMQGERGCGIAEVH